MTDSQLRELRHRLAAAGDPEAARAVEALQLALRALEAVAADEGATAKARRVCGGALYAIRWDGRLPPSPPPPLE